MEMARRKWLSKGDQDKIVVGVVGAVLGAVAVGVAFVKKWITWE